jgi:hypothetical protein
VAIHVTGSHSVTESEENTISTLIFACWNFFTGDLVDPGEGLTIT